MTGGSTRVISLSLVTAEFWRLAYADYSEAEEEFEAAMFPGHITAFWLWIALRQIEASELTVAIQHIQDAQISPPWISPAIPQDLATLDLVVSDLSVLDSTAAGSEHLDEDDCHSCCVFCVHGALLLQLLLQSVVSQ